ncbi:hypothetical protein, partial [Pseudomonas aeruginosa]
PWWRTRAACTAANQGEGALFVVRLPLAALPAEADG